MAFDINDPVEEGHDLVINEGGDQHLGTYEEFDKLAKDGKITGVHYEGPNPDAIDGDVTVTADVKSNGRDNNPPPQRDAQGHFIKQA